MCPQFSSQKTSWSSTLRPLGYSTPLTGVPTVEIFKSRPFRGRSKQVPQLGCFLVIPLSLAIRYQPVDQDSFIREIQINSLRQFLCVFIGPFQTTPSMVVISLNVLAFFNVSFFIIYLFNFSRLPSYPRDKIISPSLAVDEEPFPLGSTGPQCVPCTPKLDNTEVELQSEHSETEWTLCQLPTLINSKPATSDWFMDYQQVR